MAGARLFAAFLRAGALRFATFLRAVDFRAPVFLRAVDFRAVVFLRAADFFVDLFFVAFRAPEDAFLAGLTYAAFRQRRALRVAPAFEDPVSFDDAFRAGAAGLTVPPLLFRNSSHEELTENLMSAASLRGVHDDARICSDTVEQLGRVQCCNNSQVMKKYLTIRQEPSLAVKHFRCTACLCNARARLDWTRKPFVCKDFLRVAPSSRSYIHCSSCTRRACTRCNRVHSLSCVA